MRERLRFEVELDRLRGEARPRRLHEHETDSSELTVSWTSEGAYESGSLTTTPDAGERQITLKALRFKGTTDQVALVFADVHGTEPQGVDTARKLASLLETAAKATVPKRPKYTTIILPQLFAPARRRKDAAATTVEENRYVIDPISRALVEPNRNFPRPGESYAYVRKRGKKRELLGCNDGPLGGKWLIPYMLPETRILIQLIESTQPQRSASLHAHLPTNTRGDSPGLFVDPRGGYDEHRDRAWTAAGRSDDTLAQAMLTEALSLIGSQLPLKDDGPRVKKELSHPFAGNLVDKSGKITSGTAPTVHYATTKHPCGTSFGMWAPVAEHGGTRPATITLTVELPRYKNGTAATAAVVDVHAQVLAKKFLELP